MRWHLLSPGAATDPVAMNVLVIDVGGTHVKILATGQKEHREFESAPAMTARQMVAGVKTLAGSWRYDAVSVGYPGAVLRNRPAAEPHNLGRGWVDFDFEAAFGCPAKVINDAAMQALGSYDGGKMLFLGLRHRARLGDDRRRCRRADGARASALSKGDLRRLRRPARTRAARQETMAAPCGRGDRAPARGASARRNRAGRRQCGQGARSAAFLPAGDNANAFVGGFRLWATERREQSRQAICTRGKRNATHEEGAKSDCSRSTPVTARKAWQRARGRTGGNCSRARCGSSSPRIPRAAKRLRAEAAGVYLDYSKQRVTDETLRLLFALAEESALAAAHRRDVPRRQDQRHGEPRGAARGAARAQGDVDRRRRRERRSRRTSRAGADGGFRRAAFATERGTVIPASAIRNVVNIGIGGSDLGP